MSIATCRGCRAGGASSQVLGVPSISSGYDRPWDHGALLCRLFPTTANGELVIARYLLLFPFLPLLFATTTTLAGTTCMDSFYRTSSYDWYSQCSRFCSSHFLPVGSAGLFPAIPCSIPEESLTDTYTSIYCISRHFRKEVNAHVPPRRFLGEACPTDAGQENAPRKTTTRGKKKTQLVRLRQSRPDCRQIVLRMVLATM